VGSVNLFTTIPVAYSLIFGKKLNRLRYGRDMEITEKTRKRDYVKRAFYLADYAKEMRLTNIGNVLFGRFYDVVQDLKNTVRKHGLKISVIDYWGIVIHYVLLFIGTIVYTVYKTAVKKNMLLGDCVIIINNIVSTAGAIQGIVAGYMQFHSNALLVGNIRKFLDYRPVICENNEGIEFLGGGIDLTIENVGFRYGGEADSGFVLKDINISIKQGEKIALVGHNGAGKTTLARLLMRLYDPVGGNIKLNGTDIREYKLSSYRSLFASVFQQYKIFSLYCPAGNIKK